MIVTRASQGHFSFLRYATSLFLMPCPCGDDDDEIQIIYEKGMEDNESILENQVN